MVTARTKTDLIDFGDEYDEDGDLVDIKSAKPAKLLPKSTLEKQANLVNKRKLDALDPLHKVEPSDGWKKQKAMWEEADEDTRKSLIFGMCINDGASRLNGKFIAQFFGIKQKDLEPYKDIILMAEAVLALKGQRNAMSMALIRSDLWQAKEWFTKQFSAMVYNPSHEGVESTDTPKQLFADLTILEPQRDETGTTIAEPKELRLVKQ